MAKNVEEALTEKRLTYKTIQDGDYLSTGSTLLNLALTGRYDGGFVKGSYVLFVGDSDSGKTFWCLTCLAEASKNKSFDNYRFVLINKERGSLMDINKFFGAKVAEKLEMMYCDYLEEMYYILDDLLNEKKNDQPFICIVDSIDAMDSKPDQKKFQQTKKADQKKKEEGAGGEEAGTYGTAKAKIHANNINRILSGLERTGSILIFINQSRDKLNAGLYESKDSHSGGRAITFYSTMKIWSKKAGTLTKTFRDKKRHIGTLSKIKVVRTRVTAEQCFVEVPIYNDYGIDDIGSCVDFLVEEKRWKSGGGKINADDLDFVGSRHDLIKHIENNGFEFDLRQIVVEVWNEIKQAVRTERKPKY